MLDGRRAILLENVDRDAIIDATRRRVFGQLAARDAPLHPGDQESAERRLRAQGEPFAFLGILDHGRAGFDLRLDGLSIFAMDRRARRLGRSKFRPETFDLGRVRGLGIFGRVQFVACFVPERVGVQVPQLDIVDFFHNVAPAGVIRQ